ncbi:hypothetical protein HYV11_02925 [Candidatus Dependentiae bacterium]|nr:hypothetical protein [Candidatus Dependentiae bacterium]
MNRKMLFMSIFIGIIGCYSILAIQKKAKKQKSAIISVYVHGTLFNWRRLLSKIPAAADLTYVPDGLTLVEKLKPNTVARKMATLFCKKDPNRFSYSDFYAFGWSGKLSFQERKKWAQRLAAELIDISNLYYEKHGIRPTVRVVTFSHGGNVALHLAEFLPKNFKLELFLIACPVQNDTKDFLLYDCFSKIYMIYSMNDVIQVIDPIHVCKSIKNKNKKKLSARFFNYDIEKLKQACVSVNGKYIGHYELFQSFNKHIPMVLKQLDSSLEKKGTNILDVDILDDSFIFFNYINIIDVLNGKCKEKKLQY